MENDIRVLLQDMPTSVRGFVYIDNAYSYVIVLNARMPYEVQRKTYRHELAHIAKGEPTNTMYREYCHDRS